MVRPATIVPVHMGTTMIIGARPALGRALGRAFAVEGGPITLIARRRDGVAAVADELRASGATVGTLTEIAPPMASRGSGSVHITGGIIASRYVRLHAQPATQWEREINVDRPLV